MGKHKKFKRRPIGISPIELVHVGTNKVEKTKIELFRYNEQGVNEQWCDEKIGIKPTDILEGHVNWINIYGLNTISVINNIGEIFKINKYILADLLDTNLRPKADEQDGQLSLNIKVPLWDTTIDKFETEQITFILGENFLLCFQEIEGDLFNPIRERIKLGKGTVRQKKSEYLFFLLVDVVIDYYLELLDKSQDALDIIETKIYNRPLEADFLKAQQLRNELNEIRRAILPLREAISKIEFIAKQYFSDYTLKLFSHLQSNLSDCLESLDNQRDTIKSISDIFFSRQNSKMNEIIKWLTIMSTIFIPLTFIAGIYGMNFKYMPELEWIYGYPAVYAVMLTIVISLLFYFRKRRWI
jgi:magnesium transporter